MQAYLCVRGAANVKIAIGDPDAVAGTMLVGARDTAMEAGDTEGRFGAPGVRGDRDRVATARQLCCPSRGASIPLPDAARSTPCGVRHKTRPR